jgi:hypothetical protein
MNGADAILMKHSVAPRLLVILVMLTVDQGLQAQSAWFSAWGGAGVPLHAAPTQGGSEQLVGIRFGPDVGSSLRVLLGVERRDRTFSMGRASLFAPSAEETYTYRSDELRVQLLFAVRLAGKEKQETRLVAGLELGEAGRLQVERSYSGPGGPIPESATVNAQRTVGGFRVGLRHARVVHGPLWWFVEPWADLSLDQQPTIASPWPNERYLDLPKRVATVGLILGLEIGPRAAPRP